MQLTNYTSSFLVYAPAPAQCADIDHLSLVDTLGTVSYQRLGYISSHASGLSQPKSAVKDACLSEVTATGMSCFLLSPPHCDYQSAGLRLLHVCNIHAAPGVAIVPDPR